MKKNFMLGMSLLVLMCGLVSIGCTTTQSTGGKPTANELEGTTWDVVEGKFTGTTISFIRTNSATLTMQNIIDTGTYFKNAEMYLFQFEDGDGGGMRYRNDRQLKLNGATFILQSGDDSGDWNGTVWHADFSKEDNAMVLTCTDGKFTVKTVKKMQGKYSLQNKKVSIDFPDLKSNGNLVDNTITFGSLKFVKK